MIISVILYVAYTGLEFQRELHTKLLQLLVAVLKMIDPLDPISKTFQIKLINR